MVHTFDFEPESENKDVDLFNRLLNDKTKQVLYVVHRPGCPACDAFIPKWNAFNENMKSKGENIVLAKINVNLLGVMDLKDKHNIRGVPHIMLQKDDKLKEYDGTRDPEDLEKWLFQSLSAKSGGNSRKKSTKKSKLIKSKSKKMKKKWSHKYKKSINCRKPKGFSQKQHCKRKRQSKRKH
jgi:thiol-disulfide isomerase/thioredoxin